MCPINNDTCLDILSVPNGVIFCCEFVEVTYSPSKMGYIHHGTLLVFKYLLLLYLCF
uniref:Uncharacterized protein n=1 Tax=Amphimedon queenslandica TaxID=400682 RepID=A0A1X7VIC6_AMPQE